MSTSTSTLNPGKTQCPATATAPKNATSSSRSTKSSKAGTPTWARPHREGANVALVTGIYARLVEDWMRVCELPSIAATLRKWTKAHPTLAGIKSLPELLDEGLEPHHVDELYLVLTEKPNIAVDITPTHDRKIEALLMHRSQVGEEAADFVNRFDKQAGEQVGVEFAETFRVMTFYHEPQFAKDDPTD